MLDFDTFQNSLIALKEIHEKSFELSTLLGCDVIEFTSNLESSTLLVLESVMQDNEDWICWWLYEDVKKIITLKNGSELDLTSSFALYNFLIMEANYGKDA